ncbi:MAG: B12-binding domain-containing protein [Calditrichaceae bacterium]
MKRKIQYFNTEEAAVILGVNVSTIKRWTDSGKVECVKTAGGHRKFLIEHLKKFIEENNKYSSKIQILPIEKEEDLQVSYHIFQHDFDYLIAYTLQQALNCDRSRVQQVFNGLYLAQFQLYEIYDRLVTPVLYQIGEMWEKEIISVAEEHFASQTIKDSLIRLQGIIRMPQKRIGMVMCMNFDHELHDIALKMVDHLLELRGFKVFFSGQNTPGTRLEYIFDHFAPDRMYISSTYIDDQDRIQKEFDRICELCDRFSIQLFVGGRGFDSLNYAHPSVSKRLLTFKEVFES